MMLRFLIQCASCHHVLDYYRPVSTGDLPLSEITCPQKGCGALMGSTMVENGEIIVKAYPHTDVPGAPEIMDANLIREALGAAEDCSKLGLAIEPGSPYGRLIAAARAIC